MGATRTNWLAVGSVFQTTSLNAARAGDRVGWSNPQRTDGMRFINAVRNKVTKLLVGEVPAGACIPEVGMCCGGIPRIALDCRGNCYLARICYL